MSTGNLIIQVRTANSALPISGAQIHILDEEGNILYNLFTDESGDTEEISLNTVDRDLSLRSNYRGTPYTSYSVEIDAEGFNTLHISGVHIFEGETAIQPVELIPMMAGQRTPSIHQINLGKHAIEMPEPREQVGPLTEPYILRHVIIPNPITVHLGRPTASASNVQVSFPDYVKNVASSEIYPTWPTRALEANIYAIITFALNRVYTEWYRSRGYNFDITNSTAYDQYFVYGRTIYESVSVIVDQIFNQYVRRQGHIAPFFTSFCNGTTATCPGLSQWGTVTLANQGLSTMEILRYYYPDDIEIAETNIIANVPISYPGTALRLGSTGLDVQMIQTFLNRIRRNYPAIPEIIDEPGVFGDSTRAAVIKFQSIFNLSADGIVGKATWIKISSIYSAVTRLAELDSEGGGLGVGTVPPSSILSLGTTGMDVITLEYLLDFISEYYPTIPNITQDGIFDNQTYQAVIAFQQIMGITPDGIVGPNTWNALYDIYWGIIENNPGPNPGPGLIEYVVQPGDTLWLLAQKFHTTIDAIKKLNQLSNDIIFVGQTLLIPKDTSNPSFSYTVQPGDTLWLLSRRFQTTVEELITLNQLNSDRLDVGQVLLIPSKNRMFLEGTTYFAKEFDTLDSIAEMFQITADELMDMNCLMSDKLKVGQRLMICK